MTALAKIRTTVCPYLLLGLASDAESPEVDSAYDKLKGAFMDESCMQTPQAWVQAQQALMVIEDAHDRINHGDLDKEAKLPEIEDPDYLIPPKLGQLLVGSGKISIDQLKDALNQQAELSLPLGEILKSASLITQMELDSFLLSQRLIKLPADAPHQLGQRLIGLGLVTEDMVRIALVEQRTSEKPLGEILVERSWLAKEILDVLVAG